MASLENLMENLTITKSNRGGDLLIFENFEFKKDGKVSHFKKQRWRCNNSECKARCYTFIDQSTIYFENEEHKKHNHPALKAKIEIRMCINKMKEDAKLLSQAPKKIFQQNIQSLSEEAVAIFPAYDAIRQRLSKQNYDPYASLQIPNDLSEIELPEEFKFSCAKEQFLQFDSGKEDKERLLIFFTESNLNLMRNNRNWYMDGTFDVTPNPFYQMFTIHVIRKGKNLPCVYALLPNKKEKTYERVFEYLRERVGEPESVGIDFEQAIINAISSKFENARVYGCFFHFKQNLWRHIQACGFATEYNNDTSTRLFFRKIACLAFVPMEDVVQGFDQIGKLDEMLFKKFHTFIKYFEHNYIGELKRGRGIGRKEPRFAHEIWNVYDRCIEDMPRTNNNIEGWHNSLQKTIKRNPSIYHFIDSIKLEQNNTDFLLKQLDTGVVHKRLANYVKIDQRIKEIIKEYNTENVYTFLHNLSLLIEY